MGWDVRSSERGPRVSHKIGGIPKISCWAAISLDGPTVSDSKIGLGLNFGKLYGVVVISGIA